MDDKLFGVPLLFWGVICLSLGAVFAAFWPYAKATANVSPLRYFLLRWGHAAVWGLLALACFVRVLAGPSGGLPAQIAALLALLMYFGFIGALIKP